MLDLSCPEIRFAVETVRKASLLARSVQQKRVSSELTKGDFSPVTVADFAVQALVGSALEVSFPKDTLVAEEDTSFLKTNKGAASLEEAAQFVREILGNVSSDQICRWIDRGTADPGRRFWTLDPIDGTKGFLRNDQYAVALALLEEGEVRVAALGCPHLNAKCRPEKGARGCLVVAVKGKGAWRTSLDEGDSSFVRLHVSERKDPHEAILLRSYEPSHADPKKGDEVSRVFGTKAKPIALDSQAKHAVLAAGHGDLFFYPVPKDKPHYRMCLWDVAPGYLVVREAGGRITDLQGGEIDFTQGKTVARNPGLLYSNGHFHDLALETLRV